VYNTIVGVVTVESSFIKCRNESAQDHCQTTCKLLAKFAAWKWGRSGNILHSRHQSANSEALNRLTNQRVGSSLVGFPAVIISTSPRGCSEQT